MTRHWVAVACRDHVRRGVEGGFAQVSHGKAGPLARMAEGDWIVYYAPTHAPGGPDPCRAFVALGRIAPGAPYQVEMAPDFHPYRRDVAWQPVHEAPIVPLVPGLSFLPDKQRWGYPFRRGCFAVPEADFRRIAAAMAVTAEGEGQGT